MPAELSICLLGTGRMAKKHARLIRAVSSSSVRLCVASRDIDRARELKRKLSLERAFGSYEEAMASDCQAVLIATPPRIHLELLQKALERGKKVIVEKPAFCSLAEFERARELSERHRSVVLVAENLHFAPFHRRLVNLLRKYHWGAPVLLDIVRFGRSKVEGWRADPSEMPLGALHEGGVHWVRRLLDLSSAFEPDPFNQVESLLAYSPAVRMNENPGEDTVVVIARHRSGLVSRLVHSWGLPWRCLLADRSRFVGQRGSLYFDSRSLFGRAVGPINRFLFPSIFDGAGYRSMWKHFLRCLSGEVEPELTLKLLHYDFAYVDAAYRSLRSGREERLDFSK